MIGDLVTQHTKELAGLQRDYKAMKNSTAKRTKAALLGNIEDEEKILGSKQS